MEEVEATALCPLGSAPIELIVGCGPSTYRSPREPGPSQAAAHVARTPASNASPAAHPACCDSLEPRVLFSVALDAAPFEPTRTPYRDYQLAAAGAIGGAGDADFYCLGRLQRGDVVSVAMCGIDSAGGTLHDGVVDVLRSGGGPAPVLVAFDDDGGTGHDAFVYRFPVAADDTYFVACRSATDGRTRSPLNFRAQKAARRYRRTVARSPSSSRRPCISMRRS